MKILFRIAWVWIGLLFVACNAIPGATISPASPILSTLAVPSTQASLHPGEPIMSLDLSGTQGNNQTLTSFVWLPDGRFVLAGNAGLSFYQLPKAGLQPQSVPSFRTQVAAKNPTLLTATPDGLELAWITAGNTLEYWNTIQTTGAENIGASDSPITGLALNPNKKDLAYSTLKGEISLWDSKSQTIAKKWQQNSWLSNLSFSPDGQYLAGIDPANFTATIFTHDGQIVRQLNWTDVVNPSLSGAFFSPDWKKLAWVAQGAVQFMDVTTGKETILLSHEDAVGTIAWASDSTLFATSSTITQGGDITAAAMVWDSNTGRLLYTFPQSSPVQSITFAPDSRSLAVLDVSGQLQVWNLNQ